MKYNYFNVWDNTKCIADAKIVATLDNGKELLLAKSEKNTERIFIHLLSNLKLIQVRGSHE